MRDPIKFQVGENPYEIEFEPCCVTLKKYYKYTVPIYEGKGEDRIKTGEVEKESCVKSSHSNIYKTIIYIFRCEETVHSSLDSILAQFEFVLDEIKKINIQ